MCADSALKYKNIKTQKPNKNAQNKKHFSLKLTKFIQCLSDGIEMTKFVAEDLMFDDRTAAGIASILVAITFILMFMGWLSQREQV